MTSNLEGFGPALAVESGFSLVGGRSNVGGIISIKGVDGVISRVVRVNNSLRSVAWTIIVGTRSCCAEEVVVTADDIDEGNAGNFSNTNLISHTNKSNSLLVDIDTKGNVSDTV